MVLLLEFRALGFSVSERGGVMTQTRAAQAVLVAAPRPQSA